MKKISIISILILMCIFLSKAQTLKFETSATSNKTITYSTSGQMYNNQILKSIATANAVSSTSFTINYTSKLQIYHQMTSQTLKAFIQLNSLSGDTKYRGFEIEEVLKPSKVSFKLSHIKDGVTLQTYSFTNVAFTDLNTPSGTKNVTVSAMPSETGGTDKDPEYKLEISDVEFIYDAQDKTKYDARVTLIEKYYTSNDNVETALKKYDGLIVDETVMSKIDDLEKIVEYKSLANDNLQLSKSLQSETFMKTLSISSNDPAGFTENLALLNSKSTELLRVSTSLISKFDELYYDKGIEQVKLGKTQMAQFYFNKSINYNAKYAPSHYQIAKINYDNDNTTGALDILNNIYSMSPDSKTLALTNDLITKIYSDYVDNATAQNVKYEYDNALAWLEKASNICKKNSSIECSVSMETAYKTAYNGKFTKYLSDIDIAYKENSLLKAETAIDIATKYQSTYSTYITDNSKIVEKHILIYEKYISNADAFMITKKYDSALEGYLNAQRICNANTYVTCNENLTAYIFKARTGVYTSKVDAAETAYKSSNLDLAETTISEANTYQETYSLVKDTRIDPLVINIKQTRYTKNITEGLKNVTGQDYTKALANFDFAKEIEDAYAITKDKKLAGYITSTAKSLILQKVDEAEKKVNINDLTSARTIYTSAVEIQTKYSLTTDKEVSTEITALSEKMFKQECLNYKIEYDGYYQKAVNFIFDADYISADEQLKLAVNITTAHSECMLDATNATYKKLEIEEAVIYQTAMKTAKTSLTSKKYEAGIKKYLEAQTFFNDNDLASNFSLTHVDFYTYISEGDNDFVNYGVQYYTTEGDYDKAIYLLSVLKTRGFNKKLTKTNQTNLGIQMAIRDHFNSPTADVKTILTDYTKDDAWYKVFIKAYKKQWKSL